MCKKQRLGLGLNLYFIFLLTDAVAYSYAHFGAGSGPIHLDNVACSGSENDLTDCPHSLSVSCSNGHLEDAGVRCQGYYTCMCQLVNY